jgi:hypothetical protein
MQKSGAHQSFLVPFEAVTMHNTSAEAGSVNMT